jgi:hypothetical protein
MYLLTPDFCCGALEGEIKFTAGVNGRWALNAPDARLLNHEGSVIGRHLQVLRGSSRMLVV